MANELRPEFLSINSLNPWTQHDSSPRGYMFSASHIAQALVIDGATPRRCQTGTEREFGKYTFNIKFPYDSQIIKVIPKYRHTLGSDNIKDNPTTLIIYERVDTKEVGIVEMIRHSTAVDVKHQHFGFRYKYKSIAETISEGMVVPGGTVIADSPSIDEAGNYNYGVESNVAFMSVPGIIEDGVVVSESYLKKISSKGFEKRVTSWGKEYYPLNLYGDVNNYKPFPDIGDRIRDDGLLFALRSYDDLLGPVEMNKASLQSPDYVFDKLVYAEPGAKVVDVTVHHDTINRNPPTPVGMEVQVDKYHQAMVRYYTTILETYSELHRVRKDSLVVTPEFHRLVVEAVGYVGLDGNPLTKHLKSKDVVKRRVQKLHRRKEIDDWRVEVTFEYDVSPVDGFKITDCHGGKAVIVGVWPDEKMPVDRNGNRAEIIMDGDATIKRMNIGRLYEQWLNACSRDVTNRVRDMVDNDHKNGWKQAYDYLLGYYEICSPRMRVLFDKYPNPKQHVEEILKDGVYLWLPTDNPRDSMEAIKMLKDGPYAPTFGPVTYAEGVVTDRNVLIGSLYIMLLEKTGSDWSGVSSAKLQHFGIPARVSNSDKYSSPGRNQPVRILGESEVRLLNSVIGSDTTVDMLDQSNSPTTHKYIVNKILRSDQPTNIDVMVDRKEVPLGNARSNLFVKHIMECGGIKFVREIDDPIRAQDVENQLKGKR